MATHVGIVGCSPPGAALCFEMLSTEASSLANNSQQRFEVSMHSHLLSDYMRAIDVGNWHGVAELMLASAGKLATIGAEFLIAPCNTIHQAFDLVVAESPLPWLHIAEEVARDAQRNGYRRVALLGTRFMTEGPVYHSCFDGISIDLVVPEVRERERLNAFIFDEMVHGTFTEAAKQQVLNLILEMKAKRCDAVGLCCTELPLLLRGADSSLPLLDSTKILAQAALEVLLGERSLASRPPSSAPARARVSNGG
jgi:aspartate racemase